MRIDDEYIDFSLPQKVTRIHKHAVGQQREELYSDILTENLAYWKQQLADMPEELLLPTDRPRPAMPSSRGATYHALLPKALTENLRELSRQEGVTLNMTLVAAFQTLLSRYSGQDDIVVGTTSGRRAHLETERPVGLFANTLVVRSDLSGNPSFREL